MKRRANTSVVGRERGDTIVEVLLALAVLGAVLGAAYVITNRSIITNLVAQERLNAVKLAETQFERLKIEATKTQAVFSDTNFCMVKDPTAGNERARASDSRCKVTASGDAAPANTTPTYAIAITNVTSVNVPGRNNAGTRYRVSLTWDNAAGRVGGDRLDQYYEVYR